MKTFFHLVPSPQVGGEGQGEGVNIFTRGINDTRRNACKSDRSFRATNALKSGNPGRGPGKNEYER